MQQSLLNKPHWIVFNEYHGRITTRSNDDLLLTRSHKGFVNIKNLA